MNRREAIKAGMAAVAGAGLPVAAATSVPAAGEFCTRRFTMPGRSTWAEVLEAAGWGWVWWRHVPGSLRSGRGYMAVDWEPWEPTDVWCSRPVIGVVHVTVSYRPHVPAE